MSFPKFKHLLVEAQNRLVTITFNRPEKLNAINAQMIGELHQLMDQLEKEHSDCVLVFQGSGDKAFIAGADIAELKKRGGTEGLEGINARLFDRIAHFPFPTIAKICGYCLGGGLELALACDMRVATSDSFFAQPEVGLGIIPGAGGTFRLPAIVGRGMAREMIFSGVRIDAQRAFQIGLLNHAVSENEISQLVDQLTTRILKQSPEAVSLAKRLMSLEEAPHQTEQALLAQSYLFASKDKNQRMDNFLKKNEKIKSKLDI